MNEKNNNTLDFSEIYNNISHISESSKKLFIKKANDWLSWFSSYSDISNNNLQIIFRQFIQNYKLASTILCENKNITQTHTNRHMYYSAIVALFHHNAFPHDFFRNKEEKEYYHKEWLRLQRENSEPIREHYLENKPTLRQNLIGSISNISWKDILEVRSKMQDGSLEKLLVFVYTSMPPVRADHYATEIVLYPDEPTYPNYLLIKNVDDMTFVIRNFKTSKKYEEIRQKAPLELCDEICKSLMLIPRKWLFIDKLGNTFDRKTFSKWAGRVLSGIIEGKTLNINILRHLYISQNVDFSKSAKYLEKIGNAMGHSVSMQKGYQWTND